MTRPSSWTAPTSTHPQTGGACGAPAGTSHTFCKITGVLPLMVLQQCLILACMRCRFGEEDEDAAGQPEEKGSGPICSTALAVACYWACTLGYTVFLFIRIYDSELDDFEVKASTPTPSRQLPDARLLLSAGGLCAKPSIMGHVGLAPRHRGQQR